MTNRQNYKGHVLCTGGAGYIGSHTVVHLIELGYKVTILDNLSNASRAVIRRLEEITGQKNIALLEVDLVDEAAVDAVFQENHFDAVIHYAGLKSVGESVDRPLDYYSNNVTGTLNLLRAMDKVNCRSLVFSSSATVYKASDIPLKESDGLEPSNPYGWSKLFIEQILRDLHTATSSWRIAVLRYFNPVGAHPSGLIGESPDKPMNLLPYIQQVAVKRKSCLHVFGKEWPTRDGTGVRDYLHVEDLALGHIAALAKLKEYSNGHFAVYNLGTGIGTSVLELVRTFESATGVEIPFEFVSPRPGDLASVVADVSLANQELGWKATRSLEDACQAAYKWQSQNVYGYDSETPSKTPSKT